MADAAEGDPRLRVIYEEATRAWTLQSEVLDELRNRTGVLLAAASVASAFLGAADLDRHQKFTLLGILALIAYALVVVLCVYVLWPTGGWEFTHNAKKAIKAYVGDDKATGDDSQGDEAGSDEDGDATASDGPCDLDYLYRNMALAAESSRNRNGAKLKWLFSAFRWSAVALGASIVLWLIDLN